MRKSSADKSKSSSERGSLTPLLSIPDAAELLGIKTWTLRQWVSQRRIAYVKVGRLTKLTHEDITEFIERNRCEAVSFERRGQYGAA
jgi:excisionase family DNA binding protein